MRLGLVFNGGGGEGGGEDHPQSPLSPNRLTTLPSCSRAGPNRPHTAPIHPPPTHTHMQGPQCWQDTKEAEHRAFLIARLTAPTLHLFGHYHIARLRAAAQHTQLQDRRMSEMDLGLAATVGRALRNWATPGVGRWRKSVECVWGQADVRDGSGAGGDCWQGAT